MGRDARKNAPLSETEILDADIDPAELAEFVSGDLFPSTASPEFRERLRSDLWSLVQQRYGDRRRDRDH